MPQYLVKVGHSNPLEDLVVVAPQPRSPEGVQYAQRDVAADGTIHEQGLFIPLLWSSISTATAYQALLTQLGLASAQRAAITLYAPDFQRNWYRWNGYAIRPQVSTYATFYRDIRIMVNRLVQVGE